MELSEKLNGKANGLNKKCHFEKSQWLVNGCINPKKVRVTFVLHLKKKKKIMKLQLKLIVMIHDLIRQHIQHVTQQMFMQKITTRSYNLMKSKQFELLQLFSLKSPTFSS